MNYYLTYVNDDQWIHGVGSEVSRLYVSDSAHADSDLDDWAGFMCCLGFYCEQNLDINFDEHEEMGCPNEIDHTLAPSDVKEALALLCHQRDNCWANTNEGQLLMEVNDVALREPLRVMVPLEKKFGTTIKLHDENERKMWLERIGDSIGLLFLFSDYEEYQI